MNERKLMLACFFIVIAIIAWGDITNCSGTDKLPWPPRLVLTALVFGMLDLFSGLLGPIAPLFGIGFVIAAIVNKQFTHTDCNARTALSTAQPSDFLAAFGTGGGNGLQVD